MAVLLSSYLAPQPDSSISTRRIHITDLNPNSRVSPLSPRRSWKSRFQCVASQICDREGLVVDRGSVSFAEYGSEEELWAAVRLRIRTFYEFNQSVGLGDHRRSLAEREYKALKDRIDKKTTGFRRVSCINATLPISISVAADAHDLCSVCKFPCKAEEHVVVGTLDINQCLRLADELTGKKPEFPCKAEEHVVVGTLDINQCLRLADELTGKKPEGIGADLTRAYLSNVCVAEEMQRIGLGYALIRKSKELAKSWGITDLYVHVAVDNDAAKKLYQKRLHL